MAVYSTQCESIGGCTAILTDKHVKFVLDNFNKLIVEKCI